MVNNDKEMENVIDIKGHKVSIKGKNNKHFTNIALLGEIQLEVQYSQSVGVVRV